MEGFICPVCGDSLNESEKEYECGNGHNFDKAKSGYVNLLPNNLAPGKNHGDNKMMIKARKAFLEKCYYQPLLECIEKAFDKISVNGDAIIDAGCGECWYTDYIYRYLENKNKKCRFFAIDISKDALALGAKRNRNIKCAAASVFHLPFAENSCDIVLSVFSPFCGEEFRRVLKSEGYLVMVIPSAKHLWSLKKLIYENPYENEVRPYETEGFEFIEKTECKNLIRLNSREDIENLFKMTPYYYKTSKNDQAKIENISYLETETEFEILIYKIKQQKTNDSAEKSQIMH